MLTIKAKQRHLNNKGFSLIELIVVLAVMAVAITGAVIGISVLGKGDAGKASKNIYSALSSLRTNTLSVNASWELVIEHGSNGYTVKTYKDGECVDTVKTGSRIDITFKDEKSSEISLKDNVMVVSYRKDNGRFNMIAAGNDKSSAVNVKADGSTKGTLNIKGGGREYTVTLWYATGRVTTEE